MKILILTAALDQGGAETHIYELVRGLKMRGHDITVASAGGRIARQLKALNIRHLSIPLNSKRPTRLILSISRLRRLLRRERFHIVHVHSRIAALVCRFSLPKSNAPAVVSTVHARFKSTPLLRRLSFWGQASAAVSRDLCDYLCEEYSVSRDTVTVIPNAIDTDRFSKKEIKSTEKTPPRILFASRLDPDCSLGASLLCRIAPRLATKYPHITIAIAGGGKSFSKISALARKANEAVGYKCIKMLGHLTDMPSAFCNADVFVGVSRAALEAMSSSLPTVLCGNEGFMGIIDASNIKTAEKTNFCCRGSELPDAISLYECISALLDMTTGDRYALGKFLRDYVCRHHALENLAEHTEKFYHNALERRGNIVICGYYGFRNIGDDALLGEAIAELRTRYPDKKISVICHSPKNISKEFGTRAVARENIPKIIKEIKEADMLVFGGGSILQDATSMRSLRFYTMLIEMAAKNGVEVELLSNGLGPLKRRRAKRLVARSLSLCNKISMRDDASLSLALSLGAKEEKLCLTDDLSSRIVAANDSEVERLISENHLDDKDFFLVGIKGKTKKSKRKIIEGEIKVQIALGLSPVFVVMHAGEDKKLSRKLARKYDAPCLETLTAPELLALTKRSKLALGNRYHLLYLAKRQNIDIIPFGDDPKILGLK